MDQDLAALRRDLNLTQAALARKLGLAQSTVSRMEAGQKPTGAVRKLIEHLSEPSRRAAKASPDTMEMETRT